MCRYINDFPLEGDETYQRIMTSLNQFLDKLPSKEDKDLLLLMVKEMYLDHEPAINATASNYIKLLFSVIMSLFVEQRDEIETLSSIKSELLI